MKFRFTNIRSASCFENNVRIDASNILDYIAVGGYSALAKALSGMTPEAVLNEVKTANLRGRGGGGFPAGRKWETTRNAHGEPKYVIVNADEGDPGAYMDRSLLEGNPHGVLEGLILGAYAIGASEGFIYVRQEYPLARKHAQKALEQAREYGLLGKNILGIRIFLRCENPPRRGRFCLRRIERPDERHRRPRGRTPAEIHPYFRKRHLGQTFLSEQRRNLGQRPAYHQQGRRMVLQHGNRREQRDQDLLAGRKSQKHRTGRSADGHHACATSSLKSAAACPKERSSRQCRPAGLPAASFPESLLDLPVDFDELTKVGSMMGSGGMIVMDENTCMVDTARYYTNFLAHESCGKCVPCREGLRQMLNILNNITSGWGQEGDLELLEELSEFMESASLCALGQSAPFPVVSTLKYFREEYEEHIREKRCRAGVCTALIAYDIDQEKCEACGACLRNCPVGRRQQIRRQGLHHHPGKVHQMRRLLHGLSGKVQRRSSRCRHIRFRNNPREQKPCSEPKRSEVTMENVNLEIDGRTVEAEQGTTVLQAARSIGIKIPTLCDDDRLEAYGGCRMCMVEIETKWGRKRLVASCVYPVEEGLKVQTNTEKVDRIRQMIIELLWPAWQLYAQEYGVTSSRFKTGHDRLQPVRALPALLLRSQKGK